MIQIMTFFINPLIGTFIIEKIRNQNFSRKRIVFYYSIIFIVTNILCLSAIVLISKNGLFTIGNINLYTSKFVLKYLLSSFFISCIVIPIIYKIYPNRKLLFNDIYKKIESFLLEKKDSTIEYVKNNKVTCVIIGLSVIIFLFLMCYKLTYSALWGDELVEYNISSLPIKDGTMYKSVITTFQPPLYNWVMHYWLLINNESILWFRLFNVLLGLISGIYLYKTQLLIFKNKILGAVSLLVLGICYQWIYAVQECSEYMIMLTCLFLTIYYYAKYKEHRSLKHELLFILGCIGAMYSQYGAVFIVGPLLVIHIIDILKHENNIMHQFRTFILYALSLFVFALPLYFNYLKIQMENNKIAEYSSYNIDLTEIKGILNQLGLNIGFLWKLNDFVIVRNILSWIWIPFIIILILVAAKKYKGSALLPLTLTLLLGYVLHYFLVVLHIYAMVHANQSSGFYSRYSYFYIPIIAFIIPAGIYAITNAIIKSKEKIKYACTLLAIVILYTFSWPSVNENWHKAYDDIYANIWMENEGYNDVTYLSGGASYSAFDWYVKKAYGNQYGNNVYSINDINYKKLPKSFWLWKTNWSNEKYDEAMNIIKKKGYNIKIYHDAGLVKVTKK